MELRKREGVLTQSVVERLLAPGGVVILSPDRSERHASARARELLGWSETDEAAWERLETALAQARAAAEGDGRAVGRPMELRWQRAGEAEGRRLVVSEEQDGEGSRRRVLHLLDAEALEAKIRLEALGAGSEALGRLLRAVFHDLKSPLNTMVLNLELLRDRLERMEVDDAEAKARHLRYVGVLKEEVARLGQGLQSLQTGLLPPGGGAEPCDLRDLVRQLEWMLVARARQMRVAIQIDVPGEPVVAAAHPQLVRSMMLAVAVTVMEAMAEGGRLELGLERRASEAVFRVVVREAATFVPLAEGSADDRYNMSAGAGAGIGAAAAVAEAQGGSLSIVTGTGHDACFQLNLPISL
jgi:signal transduction histidine kinase